MKKSSENNLLFGQLKLKWKSKFTYSTNLVNVKKIILINLNNDDYKDVISLIGNNLIGYNGKTGDILFNISENTNIKNIKMLNDEYFLTYNKNGYIKLYDNKAKNIWKQNLNTKLTKILESDLIVCSSNKILYLNTKTGEKKRIVDTVDNVISVNNNVDINNDKIEDIIFTSTNHISCIDGKSGKFIWHNKLEFPTNQILNIFSLSKNKKYIILENKNTIIILNKFGLKIGQLTFQNRIKKVVSVSGYKKEYFLLLDDKDILYAYNIIGLTKEWEKKILGNTLFIKNVDLDYDRNEELIAINSTGNGILINAINSKQIDEFNLGNYNSVISANIIIRDIDKDSNDEIIFGDDKGYIYLTKYIVFKKKIFNLIIDKIFN